MTDFSRIITSSPVNATAARQTSRGVEWRPKAQVQDFRLDPIPLKAIPREMRADPGFADFTGHRHGRLTVLGLSGDPKADGKGAKWACRCACGGYCTRSSKTLKAKPSGSEMCGRCGYQQKLRDGTLKGMRNDPGPGGNPRDIERRRA